MRRELLRYGGVEAVFVTPGGILFALLACVMILMLPRRFMALPVVVAGMLVPFSERITLLGIDVTLLRLLILVSWLRIIAGLPAYRMPSLTPLDKILLSWTIASTCSFVILWADLGSLVNRLGFLYNTLGLYWLFRLTCRSLSDCERYISTLAITSAVLAITMCVEQFGYRPTAILFGGSAKPIERGGRVRSQASFGHAILAGTFGATQFPLYVPLLYRRRTRLIGYVGVASAPLIALTSMSSTPVIASAAGFLAAAFWRFRRYLKAAILTSLGVAMATQLLMKAPIWALIARVDITGSSSGYHRYLLVDRTIRNLGEWWQFGVRSTNAWGWDLWDTSNMYVDVATQGGLVTLLLFLWLIMYALNSTLGTPADPKSALPLWRWYMGASMFAHAVGFIGIAYFDQSMVPWLLLLAMTAASTRPWAPRPRAENPLRRTPPRAVAAF